MGATPPEPAGGPSYPTDARHTPPASRSRAARRRRQRVRRRVGIAVIATCLPLGAAVLLGSSLVAGSTPPSTTTIRPLSGDEADRLAGMRRQNWDQARVAVRAALSSTSGVVEFGGWLDWHHPAVYLARSEAGSGAVDQLVQAVPGLVAHRPVAGPEGNSTGDRASIPSLEPPLEPPTERWRLHESAAAGEDHAAAVDTLLMLLLQLASPELDSAARLAASEAQWLRTEQLSGQEVDVLLGPALLPGTGDPGPSAPPRPTASAASLAEMGGAVQYWLDAERRVHRLEAMLTETVSVQVEFDRTDRTEFQVVDLLGGSPVDPRPVTEQEAQQLAQLPQGTLAAAGGEITVRLPGAQGGDRRAAGWLDWQRAVAYLATYRDGAPDGLMWVDAHGVAARSDHPPRAGLPPLPVPPADGGWQRTPWQERATDTGEAELDLLLNRALARGGLPEASEPIRERAHWLREDQLAGTPVNVYEFAAPEGSDVAPAEPGQAPLRYWVDDETGLLLRIEIRAHAGGFGQLDITPAEVPALG